MPALKLAISSYVLDIGWASRSRLADPREGCSGEAGPPRGFPVSMQCADGMMARLARTRIARQHCRSGCDCLSPRKTAIWYGCVLAGSDATGFDTIGRG